jgi:hypothetical protein
METDQTIEILSLEDAIDSNPHQRFRRTRDFRIDTVRTLTGDNFIEDTPGRAEKLKEHTERIQECLLISTNA